MPKVTVTTASTEKVPANVARKGLFLDNISANAIHFRFTSPVSVSGVADAGPRLNAGERLFLGAEHDRLFNRAIYMIAAVNSDLVYEEIL